jgi:hypothetical protein
LYKDFEIAYSESSELFSQFGKTTESISFNTINEAVEIYYLMSIKVAQNNSKAISVLLNNHLPLETNHIIRNIMETFFKLNWVVKDNNREAMLDRVNQLEANPFSKYEKEMNYVGKHLKEVYAPFDEDDWKSRMKLLEDEKEKQPQLLKDIKDGKKCYKSSPTFTEIMGEAYRVKYYNIYCFISAYVHPSPFLKIFLLRFHEFDKLPNDIMYEPVKQSLVFGLLFLELIMAFCVSIFDPFNSDKSSLRMSIYNKQKDISTKFYGGFHHK